MKFQKGHPKLDGAGRPPGSPNRVTLAVREYLEGKGINLIEQILARFPKLEPRDQVKVLMDLMPYAHPKLSSVTVEAKSPEEEELAQLTIQELKDKAKAIVLAEGEYARKEDTTKEEATVSSGDVGSRGNKD